MVTELPEELLDQAKFLLTLPPNSWERTCTSEVALEYLFSLLFKEKERP